MKQLLLNTTFLFITIIGFGQCPTGDIQLFSQSAIDSFAADYPNCEELNGNLDINGTGITNLNGLSVIEASSGSIEIYSTSVTSLQGLNNLVRVNDLDIQQNFLLESFDGLNQLELVENNLTIRANPLIENFVGFESLTEIQLIYIDNNSSFINFEGINPTLESLGSMIIDQSQSLTSFSGLENIEYFFGFLNVSKTNISNFQGLNNLKEIQGTFIASAHNSLTNFSGLEQLESIGGLHLFANANLESLIGLENLSAVSGIFNITSNYLLTSLTPLNNIENANFGEVVILGNFELTVCDILSVCEHLAIPTSVTTIENNAPGCNSIAEVEIECGIVDIPDTNFLNALLNYTPVIDVNGDAAIQFDEAEAFTGSMDVSDKIIFDFTGLEAFVNITGFNGSENFMNFLSLKSNTLLASVDFSDCPDLEAVNLKNGNNTTITTFNGIDCPSLQFICVDNVPFAEANFTNIDPQVQFVDDCEFLAVPSFNLEDGITVFPNPVSDNLTISILENFSYIKAEVYSVGGQKLKETSASQINMSDLTAGIYFVKVISEEGNITKKIVKQ